MSESEANRPSPKETSHGLPVISEETTLAIWETYTTGEIWGDHLEDVKNRLLTENPHLVRFIERQVSKFPNPLHLPLFEIFATTIAVLEHQAASNKLSSTLNIDSQESSID